MHLRLMFHSSVDDIHLEDLEVNIIRINSGKANEIAITVEKDDNIMRIVDILTNHDFEVRISAFQEGLMLAFNLSSAGGRIYWLVE